KMVSLKPSVSSYARISYARELLGDVPGAARAMRLAVDSAVGEPEALAWSLTQLGKLYWSNGRLGEAAREYRVALEVHPRYPAALNALAVVEAARGRRPRAIALARTAAEILPLPQYVATLGDLLHDKAARRQYALVGAIARLERAQGVNLALEIALFDVDHRIDLQRTVELARLAQRERPSIDGDDVLAWALARTGGCREALKYSRLALRLGTRDAPKFFHRGVIERCLGHHREARAWFARAHRTNPYWRQPRNAASRSGRSSPPLRCRGSRRRTPSATSRSTASAASKSRGRACTCATSSTSPRSRRSRPGRSMRRSSRAGSRTVRG